MYVCHANPAVEKDHLSREYQSTGGSSATAYIPESNHANGGAALEEQILDCSVDEEFEPEMYEEYV
jgi:hypothetical protein